VPPQLWLVRHAETEWSASGRHTSRTEVSITEAGRKAARALAPLLARHRFALVLVSPRARAHETAELAGFADPEVDENLAEWDYGELEALTTAEIRARGGEWSTWTIWTGDVPGGETIAQVAARASAVLARVDRAPGDVLCFGHGHMSRVLAAVALGLAPDAGRRFVLDPATMNVVGDEHECRALRMWNVRPSPFPAQSEPAPYHSAPFS
jgi:broad specificity phosphatase PhoE